MLIVGIPGNDSLDEHNKFVSNHRLEDIPQVPDLTGELWSQLGVTSQPRWVLVRADGSVERGGGGIPGDIVDDALSPA